MGPSWVHYCWAKTGIPTKFLKQNTHTHAHTHTHTHTQPPCSPQTYSSLGSLPQFLFIGSSLALVRTGLMFWCLLPAQSLIHLLSVRLLRTSSGQSLEWGAGDPVINRIWFLPCRRPVSSWGDGNWNRQFPCSVIAAFMGEPGVLQKPSREA